MDSEARTVLGLSRQRILTANSLATGGSSISWLRRDLVHLMPVQKRTAKDGKNFRSAAVDVLRICRRQDVQYVGSLIPAAQPGAVLLMGAPSVGPLFNLADGSGIQTRLGRRALVLVADELEHAPKVPCAFGPEIDDVEEVVQVIPYLGPNHGLGLVAVQRPENGSHGSDIVVVPGVAGTRRDNAALVPALLGHVLVDGEEACRTGRHVPVEAHAGLGNADVVCRDAPVPGDPGGERHPRVGEACLRHVDCDFGHRVLLQTPG